MRLRGAWSDVLIVAAGIALLLAAPQQHVSAGHNPDYCNLVLGTASSETLSGSAACEDLWARAGNDVVNSGGGDDDAHGEDGADLVRGQGAADWLWGGPHNDELHGGDGNHDLTQDNTSNDSDDHCGGAGSDIIDTSDGDGNDEAWTTSSEADVASSDFDDDFHIGVNCPFS